MFLCDVKGDVAGICAPGVSSEGMEKRIDRFGLRGSFAYKGYPTTFWDIYQTGGHAVRATVSDMGPELLSRILSLTPAQEGILHIVFRIADDKGLLLLDLKDLRAMLNYVSEHRAEYMMTYGNITPQSVAAILRALLPLEQQRGDLFFGEPPLDIYDWMRTDADGRGMVNVGKQTAAVVRYFLTSGKETEQGYKACASMTKLADRYGTAQLENARERLLAFTSTPSIRTLSTILIKWAG